MSTSSTPGADTWDDPLPDQDAQEEARALRASLEERFPAAVRTVLDRIAALGAVQRAVDALLDPKTAIVVYATELPRVDRDDWEDGVFQPTVPVPYLLPGEMDGLARQLTYLRGVLSLRLDAATEALRALYTGAHAEGVDVPSAPSYHQYEYPSNVDPTDVDRGGSAVFAAFPRDTWREAPLRAVVGAVLAADRAAEQ